jgi:hypothetical protein
MKDQILSNLDNPGQLEKLYRTDKSTFKRVFNALYPDSPTSAILFRIREWGITPNRTAVLGGNVLILINLLLVTVQLFRAVTKKGDSSGVGKAISFYLPIYFVWTIIVTFIFPLLFGFR